MTELLLVLCKVRKKGFRIEIDIQSPLVVKPSTADTQFVSLGSVKGLY